MLKISQTGNGGCLLVLGSKALGQQEQTTRSLTGRGARSRLCQSSMLSLARPRLRCSTRYSLSAPQRCLSAHAHVPAVNALIPGTITPVYPSSGSGPLAGLRLAVKDNICTKSLPTTCSSKILEGFASPFDATVVSLLSSNGAQIVGKANCDEFGMG